MAKIERVEDLPAWFDLDKYRAADNFTAAHWLEQLDRRAALLSEQQKASGENLQSANNERHPILGDTWWAIVSGPLNAVREDPVTCQYACKGVLVPAMPVRSVFCFDLAMQAHRDRLAKRDGGGHHDMVNRWAAISDPVHPIKSAAELGRIPIEIDFYDSRVLPTPVVQVDLGASDAVLKEAFSAWLKETRASSPPATTKRSKPLYERWVRYGLLPYLDLMIWSLETETHIPDRVMSAAISSYDAGEANLRKTVAPLAESLMRDLSELQALAAIEAARSSAEAETFEG